jgi:hypothetical protein
MIVIVIVTVKMILSLLASLPNEPLSLRDDEPQQQMKRCEQLECHDDDDDDDEDEDDEDEGDEAGSAGLVVVCEFVAIRQLLLNLAKYSSHHTTSYNIRFATEPPPLLGRSAVVSSKLRGALFAQWHAMPLESWCSVNGRKKH